MGHGSIDVLEHLSTQCAVLQPEKSKKGKREEWAKNRRKKQIYISLTFFFFFFFGGGVVLFPTFKATRTL